MGGLFEFLMAFGCALSSPFILRLFYSSLIGRVYRIQTYLKDMAPYYSSSFVNGKMTAESVSEDDLEEETGTPPNTDNSKKNTWFKTTQKHNN